MATSRSTSRRAELLFQIITEREERASVRINGQDVEPAVAEQQLRHGQDAHDSTGRFGMQCSLYSTPHGTSGTQRDGWIIDA